MDQWEQYLRFRDGFVSILDERYYPAPWLDSEVYAGFVKLFCCDDAAILAELKVYPSELMEVHGVAATGCLASIKQLILQAEQWGRDEGCATASISSREAWAKILPDYKVYQISIRKDL